MLIYLTLHYQNGGLKIDDMCETKVKNLYASGEVSGGDRRSTEVRDGRVRLEIEAPLATGGRVVLEVDVSWLVGWRPADVDFLALPFWAVGIRFLPGDSALRE